MNGKASKYCRKFAVESFNRTEEKDRPMTLKNYLKNIKKEYTKNADFKKFVKKMISL
jgi:hypothetical protein